MVPLRVLASVAILAVCNGPLACNVWAAPAQAESPPEPAAGVEGGKKATPKPQREGIEAQKIFIPAPEPTFTAAETALRKTMDADATYTGTQGFHPRDIAVAEWKELLKRTDLTKEQQGFAWWRIGSLYGCNFSRARGEGPDFKLSEEAFIKARELLPNLVCTESLNCATVYATVPGPLAERAGRLAESFNWLATRTSEDVDRSAKLVNTAGGLLDNKMIPGLAGRDNSVEARRLLLQKQLAESRQVIVDRIVEAIRYSRDPSAQREAAPATIDKLLKLIEETASPETMKHFRSIQSGADEAKRP
jgi:hypothetical protein